MELNDLWTRYTYSLIDFDSPLLMHCNYSALIASVLLSKLQKTKNMNSTSLAYEWNVLYCLSVSLAK